MSTETLTNKEACYLQERIKFATETARAAVALEQGNESLHWAIKKEANCAKFGIGFFGRTLTKERKAELTKMAARNGDKAGLAKAAEILRAFAPTAAR